MEIFKGDLKIIHKILFGICQGAADPEAGDPGIQILHLGVDGFHALRDPGPGGGRHFHQAVDQVFHIRLQPVALAFEGIKFGIIYTGKIQIKDSVSKCAESMPVFVQEEVGDDFRDGIFQFFFFDGSELALVDTLFFSAAGDVRQRSPART